MNRTTDLASWSDPLIRRFKRGRMSSQHVDDLAEANCRERTRLVAIVRWLLLLILALYGALAGSTYLFSRYGFFITKEQTLLLGFTLLSVVVYNLSLHFNRAIFKCNRISFLQIILDLIAVTVLVHCSGGATSWFWPVYLIVTLEAAYLLENQRDVWQIGATGGILYCTLLFLEQRGIIPSVRMPFVDPALNLDTHYLFLMAVWVMITNAATAIIANFLMSVIRREARLARENEERLFIFIDNANDLIHCNDAEGNILFMNRAMRKALGYSTDELERKGFNGILMEDSRETCSRELQKIISGSAVDSFELNFRGGGGRENFAGGKFP